MKALEVKPKPQFRRLMCFIVDVGINHINGLLRVILLYFKKGGVLRLSLKCEIKRVGDLPLKKTKQKLMFFSVLCRLVTCAAHKEGCPYSCVCLSVNDGL